MEEKYVFKPGPELIWAAVTAAVVVVLQLLIVFDPKEIDNWEVWAVSAGGAIARAAAAAVLNVMRQVIVSSDNE